MLPPGENIALTYFFSIPPELFSTYELTYVIIALTVI